MNALFERFHNFLLPLVRGEDGVCACTCGRHHVYHVLPYHGAQSITDSRDNYVVKDILTKQEMNMMVGLVMGLCVSLLLQWLDRVWLSRLSWRANQTNDVGLWSWMPKFFKTKKLHPQQTEDSTENMLHLKQDVYNDVNGT